MSLKICIFCASSAASETAFGPLADATGTALAAAGHTLVYGGGSTGLMGRVARAVHAQGGRVIGVIPQSMKDVETAYQEADQLIVTQTMRERKQVMDDHADAFLILPGGFGTLEELSEAITHAYLGFHSKPVVIVNTQGFYDPLIALFESFITTGMAKERYRDTYAVVNTLEEGMAVFNTNR